MKQRFFIIVALFLTSATAMQSQKIGEWKVYLSYWNSTGNEAVEGRVYALCEGNLLSYNTEDSEVRTYDQLTGLNGVHIGRMGYSAGAGRLMLVYDDSNIDLMDEEGEIVNMSALRDKNLSGRNVNGIFVEGTTAWLATGFGFVEVDMQEAVFRNTYLMGFSVNGIAATDSRIFLATDKGVYSCLRSENMHETARWSLIDDQPALDIVPFGGKLLVRRSWCIYRMDDGGSGSVVTTDRFDWIHLSGGAVLWGNSRKVELATSLSQVRTIETPREWKHASYQDGTLWASEGEHGLCAYRLTDDGLSQAAGPIQPNSPKHDLCYRIRWEGDRLLVAGGINTVDPTYNPLTAMYYEEGQWTNFSEMEEWPQEYTRFNPANTTHLVQDPHDSSHHFASLHRNGLAEYRDGKFVRLLNSDNSPIRSILPDAERYYNYVSCAGLTYDSEGNLWMLNSETDTIVRILRKDGRWASLFYPEIAGVSMCDDYLMHSSGLIFLNSRRTDNHGFFCFDTNGTLTSVRDDRHRLRQTVTNQDGTVYLPDEFYCMTEDLDGRIWCGTDRGLFVINDAEAFLTDENFQYEQVKIPRNDGSGLADYLLNGVAVSCIAIDGANRKWIGTIGNGVYLVSADGTDMIHHFLAADSPLLNDNIQCLAVHPVSGMVMVGTEAGLCSFVSDATEAAAELSADSVTVYPNPVRPDYRGPITVKGLTMGAEIKILSSSGQLVARGTSSGGTFTWNGQDQRGRRVASGVYHIVANNAEGKKAIVTRIIIIR